jgi:flagellin-like hook-associated protein FlgL
VLARQERKTLFPTLIHFLTTPDKENITMELTNHSYLNSRNNYLSSLSSQKLSAERFASGKKLDRSGTDVGALSQESNRRIELLNDRASIVNLKNARSFLYAQETSLHRVYEMYDKIETLAIKAANPNTTKEERRDYNLEFNDYKEQLENLMVSRYNDKLLFSNTLMCGGPKNVELKELDMDSNVKKGNASHAVRAQTVFTGSPSGTVSFRVNSGGIGDTYRVWMGNVCVFSAGPAFQGPDHTEQYNDNALSLPGGVVPATGIKTQDINFPYPGHGWRTTGSAANGNSDLFEVSFAPGEKTTYKVIPGASNDDGSGMSGLNPYDPATGLYNNIITNDLPGSFDRTEMTIQLETRTIGVIYEDGSTAAGITTGEPKRPMGTDEQGVVFTPSEFIRKIPTDAHGNVIELNSKGFETLEIDFLLTAADAQELVDVMRGHGVHMMNGMPMTRFGEMKCLLENRLGILGAEYRRVDYEVEELEKQIVADENALGRITDADMAKEATNFAKESLKMKLASEVMSNISRLKDVLIPLTTEHFRSEVLSATL